MSGIYIHIPFCKQACHYCDFHFSTNLNTKEKLVESILFEIELRKNYLSDNFIETIYFGGGTPSLLSEKEIHLILETIYKNYDVSENPEITFECNPDDLSNAKLQELKSANINRLSIGLQSFNDDELKWMNRAHTASESEASVKRAQDKGFENITIDLIYGSKFCDLSSWKKTLNKAIALDVKHISSYNLTIEEKTKFGHDLKLKKEPVIDDEKSAELFLEMIERLEKAEFIQYEISNFGKKDFFSKHNSNYWKGVQYIGFGPSAHSFDGNSRQWNISNNHLYIKNVGSQTESYFEKEILTEENRWNEYMLTSLRTIWGINETYLSSRFKSEHIHEFKNKIEDLIKKKLVQLKNQTYTLTLEGKLMADKIASDLFM